MTHQITSRRARSRSRMLRALVLALALTAIVVSVALAQSDLGGKLRSGSEVRVAADETIAGDLYAFAGTIVVDGSVEGDVVAAGGTISIGGTVGGDVAAAGGTVRIDGDVTGDVRTAGGQVTVDGAVGEDLVAAGGQVDLAAGGTVGEDLILSAGQATVAGTVDGNATGTAGTYSRTGTVGGEDDVLIAPRDDDGPVAQSNPVIDAVEHFVAVLLVGALAMWLVPRLLGAAEENVRERPLVTAGWGIGGFVGWIGLIVVLVIAMAVLAGILALLNLGSLVALDVFGGIVAILALLLAFFVVVGFLADAIVGLALARRFAPDGMGATAPRATVSERWRPLLLLAVGAAVVVLVSSLPVVGGIVKLVVALLGLGAVVLALWRRDRRAPRTAEAPAA